MDGTLLLHVFFEYLLDVTDLLLNFTGDFISIPSRSGSIVARPTFSFSFPFNSIVIPWILSLVLSFIMPPLRRSIGTNIIFVDLATYMYKAPHENSQFHVARNLWFIRVCMLSSARQEKYVFDKDLKSACRPSKLEIR